MRRNVWGLTLSCWCQALSPMAAANTMAARKASVYHRIKPVNICGPSTCLTIRRSSSAGNEEFRWWLLLSYFYFSLMISPIDVIIIARICGRRDDIVEKLPAITNTPQSRSPIHKREINHLALWLSPNYRGCDISISWWRPMKHLRASLLVALVADRRLPRWHHQRGRHNTIDMEYAPLQMRNINIYMKRIISVFATCIGLSAPGLIRSCTEEAAASEEKPPIIAISSIKLTGRWMPLRYIIGTYRVCTREINKTRFNSGAAFIHRRASFRGVSKCMRDAQPKIESRCLEAVIPSRLRHIAPCRVLIKRFIDINKIVRLTL